MNTRSPCLVKRWLVELLLVMKVLLQAYLRYSELRNLLDELLVAASCLVRQCDGSGVNLWWQDC